MAKKTKKVVEEEKEKEAPVAPVPPGYDPDLPDSKQRWLRE